MSEIKQADDLSPEEIADIDEFYNAKDRKTSSIEEFLEELRKSRLNGFQIDARHFPNSLEDWTLKHKKG